MMEYKLIKNFDEYNSKDVTFFEQETEIRFTNNGWYNLTIERDNEGNITDIKKEILETYRNQDIEIYILNTIIDDGYFWYDLDQLTFDADEGEIIKYDVNIIELVGNNFFDKEEMEFLKDKEENGYIRLEIKINENIIYYDDEDE